MGFRIRWNQGSRRFPVCFFSSSFSWSWLGPLNLFRIALLEILNLEFVETILSEICREAFYRLSGWFRGGDAVTLTFLCLRPQELLTHPPLVSYWSGRLRLWELSSHWWNVLNYFLLCVYEMRNIHSYRLEIPATMTESVRTKIHLDYLKARFWSHE